MMELPITQDALFAAAAKGNIPTIAAYFAHDLVRAELAQANETAAVSETFQLGCWYRMNRENPLYRSSKHFLFGVAIKHGQVAVIEWFFSPDRAGCFDAVLAALLPNIGRCAMRSSTEGVEMMEMILSSRLFHERLPAARQEKFLVMMLFLTGDSINEAARETLTAHGAPVNGRANDPPHHSLRTALGIRRKSIVNRPTEQECPLIELLLTNGVDLVDTDVLPSEAYRQYPTMSLRLLAGTANGANAAKALGLATRLGWRRLAKYLLENGFVDVDARGVFDETPLVAATQCSTRPKWSCLSSGESEYSRIVRNMVQLFLDYGADHTLTDRYNKTCLERALERSLLHVVAVLVEHGADPNRVASSGRYLLEVVLSKAQPGKLRASMVPVLLRHGADPSLVTSEGRSFYDLVMERDDGQAFVDAHAEFFSKNEVEK